MILSGMSSSKGKFKIQQRIVISNQIICGSHMIVCSHIPRSCRLALKALFLASFRTENGDASGWRQPPIGQPESSNVFGNHYQSWTYYAQSSQLRCPDQWKPKEHWKCMRRDRCWRESFTGKLVRSSNHLYLLKFRKIFKFERSLITMHRSPNTQDLALIALQN